MQGHRLGICARRPAPLQVRYLGLAGTTGAAFFDYIIADAVAIPQSHQAYYSEKLVYLPHCYQINNRQQPVAETIYARQEFGLPSEGVVFCAFSSHYKLDPIMFASWMKILAAVKESVLWLIPGTY
jgi:predicted O-linked N-acetylglucosamine transferase (SPINDLY family)